MTVSNQKLDRIAIFLSGLCLVHCLALPVALLVGTVFGEWLLATETQMHWLLLGLAAPVSLWALGHNARYGAYSNLLIGCLGLALMLVGVSHVAGELYEALITTLGVVLVLIAHVRNFRTRHTH